MAKMPCEYVEPIFKVKTITTSAISYTPNVENSSFFDISNETPSGYYPVGIVGYNTQVPSTIVRRLFLGGTTNERVNYSITAQNAQSMGLIVLVLYIKNEYISS